MTKVKFIFYLFSEDIFSGERYLSSVEEKLPCQIVNGIKMYNGKALYG